MKNLWCLTLTIALFCSTATYADEINIKRFSKRTPASTETVSKQSSGDPLSILMSAEGFFRLDRYETKSAKFSSRVVVFDQGSMITSHKLIFVFSAGDFDGGVFVFEPSNFAVSDIKTLANGKYFIRGSHFDEEGGKIKGKPACYNAILDKSADGLVPSKLFVNSVACPK